MTNKSVIIKISFFFLFLFFSPRSNDAYRWKTSEQKATFEQRHGDDGAFGRCFVGRRDNHIVVHIQPAAAAIVDHSGHGGHGPCARGTVQLGRAAARELQAGDKRSMGQVQRSRHGNDHHENRKVSVVYNKMHTSLIIN